MILTGHRTYQYQADAGVTQTDPLYQADYQLGSTNYLALEPVTATVYEPAMVRTGNGSITLSAALDVALTDPASPDPSGPGVVYTAGEPVAPAAGGNTTSVTLSAWAASQTGGNAPYGIGISALLTSVTNPQGGGDIAIRAQRDVIGDEGAYDESANSSGATGLSDNPGAYIGQFWTPWLLASSQSGVPWYVNFGSFSQGVMSLGGTVSVVAGRDISQLSVSLPTTAILATGSGGAAATTLVGGGTLTVRAGGDILSGDYYVGQGTGALRAGGAIGANFAYTTAEVSTLLAVQNATMLLQARQSVDIGRDLRPDLSVERRLREQFDQLSLASGQPYLFRGECGRPPGYRERRSHTLAGAVLCEHDAGQRRDRTRRRGRCGSEHADAAGRAVLLRAAEHERPAEPSHKRAAAGDIVTGRTRRRHHRRARRRPVSVRTGHAAAHCRPDDRPVLLVLPERVRDRAGAG